MKDKVILITGGTGSFGQALAAKLLRESNPAKVIILSRDEWKQWEMGQKEPFAASDKIRFFLGDVRDKERLRRAFAEVDYVVHAAALKQVPAAEYNPTEFVQTNVDGSKNVIDAALDCGVKKVIALSTDKAVNPVNLYGATKLCADKLFTAANVYAGRRGYPRFSVVRYGNVLGSRGSVIARWRALEASGVKEVPITDERMTRFWITLDHAVEFVINAFDQMTGGEIFIPKCPSLKITDLATAVAPSLKHHYTGIRPGEKLHELLLSQEDARRALDCGNHFTIESELIPTSATGVRLPTDFCYTSDTNSHWLDKGTLAKLLATIPS